MNDATLWTATRLGPLDAPNARRGRFVWQSKPATPTIDWAAYERAESEIEEDGGETHERVLTPRNDPQKEPTTRNAFSSGVERAIAPSPGAERALPTAASTPRAPESEIRALTPAPTSELRKRTRLPSLEPGVDSKREPTLAADLGSELTSVLPSVRQDVDPFSPSATRRESGVFASAAASPRTASDASERSVDHATTSVAADRAFDFPSVANFDADVFSSVPSGDKNGPVVERALLTEDAAEVETSGERGSASVAQRQVALDRGVLPLGEPVSQTVEKALERVYPLGSAPGESIAPQDERANALDRADVGENAAFFPSVAKDARRGVWSAQDRSAFNASIVEPSVESSGEPSGRNARLSAAEEGRDASESGARNVDFVFATVEKKGEPRDPNVRENSGSIVPNARTNVGDRRDLARFPSSVEDASAAYRRGVETDRAPEEPNVGLRAEPTRRSYFASVLDDRGPLLEDAPVEIDAASKSGPDADAPSASLASERSYGVERRRLPTQVPWKRSVSSALETELTPEPASSSASASWEGASAERLGGSTAAIERLLKEIRDAARSVAKGQTRDVILDSNWS